MHDYIQQSKPEFHYDSVVPLSYALLNHDIARWWWGCCQRVFAAI